MIQLEDQVIRLGDWIGRRETRLSAETGWSGGVDDDLLPIVLGGGGK